MRVTIVFLFTFFFASLLFAQEEETLLGNNDFTFGGYGGTTFGMGYFSGGFVPMSGGYGAFLIGHTFAIGGKGNSTVVGVETDYIETRYADAFTVEYQFSYGGVLLEYIHNWREVIHITGAVVIGAGSVSFFPPDKYKTLGYEPDYKNDAVFVFEPSFAIQVNIVKWMRSSIGASYRFVSGTEENILPNYKLDESELMGPSVYVSFDWGLY